MDLSDIPTPLWSLLASFAGAWFAARIALRRFYDEKVWERKTGAYTAIFEALFDMSLWFDAHIKAEMYNKELSDEEQSAFSSEYRQAMTKLKRRLAAEAWLVPGDCKLRLDDMFRALGRREDSWVEMLDAHSAKFH